MGDIFIFYAFIVRKILNAFFKTDKKDDYLNILYTNFIIRHANIISFNSVYRQYFNNSCIFREK